MPSLAYITYGTRGSVNLVGILGNIISFVIFSRSAFSKNSIGVYCRALALFNCFTLNQLAADVALFFYDSYPPDFIDIYCKLSYYITVVGSSITAWILVAFSVDKMLSMKKQPRFDFIKKRSFQLGLIVGIFFFHLVLYIELPILLYSGLDPKLNETKCIKPYDSIIGALYLVEASLIPFIVMVYSSVVIIRTIGQSRRKSIVGKEAVRKRRTRDFKFALTSLSLNFLFISLKLPLVLFYALSSVGFLLNDDYFQIATLLFFANASISFFVYVASNSLFRRELVDCVNIRRRSSLVRPADTMHRRSTLITVRPLPSIEEEK